MPSKKLAQEFRELPIGQHSLNLQRLLNVFRSEPLEGKHILICTKPHEQWILGKLSGIRGEPIKLYRNKVFHSIHEAEWYVFKRRWHIHTGDVLE